MSVGVTTSEVVLPSGLPVCVAAPEGPGPFPCVVWLHERYGFVTHTREYAEKIAGGGYVVAAPDLYYEFPDQDALHRGDARFGQIGDPLVDQRLVETVGHLSEHPNADVARLGMIGVCATGRYPLVYGSHRSLQAAVVYYGATNGWDVTDSHPETMPSIVEGLSAPVLGLFGERDHNIPVTEVCGFRNLLEEHNKSYRIRMYEGAPHGFINDTMSGRYHPLAETGAFLEMQRFFAENLSDCGPGRDVVTWDFQATMAVDYDFSKNVRLE
jgi:carboxymethylenebutenolidase